MCPETWPRGEVDRYWFAKGKEKSAIMSAGRFLLPLLSGLWLVAVCAGMFAFWDYSFTQGEASATPVEFPRGSLVTRIDGQPCLIMFVHPMCGCTNASVKQICRLLQDIRSTGHSVPHLTFVVRQPSRTEPAWCSTSVLQLCGSIPGASVIQDYDGHESRRFGVTTSGTCCLFNRNGQRTFVGGITIARGHEGPAPGASQLKTAITDQRVIDEGFPVFGCALFSETQESEQQITSRRDRSSMIR